MDLKLSYYTIFSDPVNAQGDVILFGTRTGQAITIRQSVMYALQAGAFDSLDTKMLDRLTEIKALVPAGQDELRMIVEDNKETINKNAELYEIIQPTAMCQLGCDYCGQGHTKDYITDSLSRKLLERVEMKLANGNFKSLFIGWFGAEPLMGLRQIRELSAKLKELAASKNVSYGAKMVTNGLSLKPAIFKELTKEMGIQKIEVTLDGIGEYHDQRRHTKEKTATFDLIFANLLSIFNLPDFHDYGCQITLRCNVDHRNMEGVSPLIKLLAEHKLQDKIAYFYPIGVYSWGGNDAHEKSLTKEEFAQMEINWMMEMLENGFIPSFLPNRVKQVCMAVSPVSEMYDAFGNIFKCTEVSYSTHYKDSPLVLGNLKIDNQFVEKNNVLQRWYDDVQDQKFPCSTCKMLPVCGGGCPKSWHEDMRACPTAKFNIKERLALSYVASKAHINELAVS